MLCDAIDRRSHTIWLADGLLMPCSRKAPYDVSSRKSAIGFSSIHRTAPPVRMEICRVGRIPVDWGSACHTECVRRSSVTQLRIGTAFGSFLGERYVRGWGAGGGGVLAGGATCGLEALSGRGCSRAILARTRNRCLHNWTGSLYSGNRNAMLIGGGASERGSQLQAACSQNSLTTGRRGMVPLRRDGFLATLGTSLLKEERKSTHSTTP